MKLLRQVSVPTGDILIVEGERGSLELLSIGDYGKDVNIKCDAMGLSRDPAGINIQRIKCPVRPMFTI